jgi:type I restriction enzyme R subunit
LESAELDQALTTYSGLEGFEEDDIAHAVSAVRDEVTQLPQRHAELLDVFKEVASNPAVTIEFLSA